MYILSDIFKGDYPISQTFGARPAYYSQFYIYGIRQKGHEGVDWATPVGVEITSPFDGVVLRAGKQNDFPNYGLVVVVWDPIQKCATWHCHLSKVSVVVGQKVKKGQVLGKTGQTGNTDGPHLHFCLVETDGNGNRLHRFDGYGGFINCLDPRKVKWVLGQPTVDPYVEKVDRLNIAIDTLNRDTDSDSGNVNMSKKDVYNRAMARIKRIHDTGGL